jgi:hypothetical protein
MNLSRITTHPNVKMMDVEDKFSSPRRWFDWWVGRAFLFFLATWHPNLRQELSNCTDIGIWGAIHLQYYECRPCLCIALQPLCLI